MKKMNEFKQDILNSTKIKILGSSILGAPNNSKFLRSFHNNILKDNNCDIKIICESENQLFQFSLLTDVNEKNRISFVDFQIRRDYISELFYGNEQAVNVSYSSLNIPFFAIATDTNIWFCPTTKFELEDYFLVDISSEKFLFVKEYLDYIFNGVGDKFISNKGDEQLELFDQNKIPRGIFPRNSFYDTDHYQYVIWGLVFNRSGKLLIHKRKENAKDNQNMWDKSVGGHIDFHNERSSHEAAVRELIEELYTEEKKEQSGHAFSMLSEDSSKVLFLGDWRKESYGSDYFNHINVLDNKKPIGEENWVFYKIPSSITHNTPRLMPDNKGEKWLRVIVDIFIFITNTEIDEKYISNHFKNSQYKLVEPNILKSHIDNKQDEVGNEFIITPDLKFIMTGSLRDTISEVSNSIKFSTIRK